ncbi:uncharacterized protein B0I36DRAFT_427269 [Microdochium trichocladiopsis]|uniref:Uncharacterized protein n=1 Tax=Microdochium trichocladiopsis TaxID=1682393 RepID=A0A9P8YJ63_9PEZI|nr:uncharacterized protein B0I36DRAFT_427269 [Microdochium trichocladiopsis]KAH7040957.1 hypothetical protein B0I36DRAFT_427269 [Microdochium trichocladiopsis]
MSRDLYDVCKLDEFFSHKESGMVDFEAEARVSDLHVLGLQVHRMKLFADCSSKHARARLCAIASLPWRMCEARVICDLLDTAASRDLNVGNVILISASALGTTRRMQSLPRMVQSSRVWGLKAVRQACVDSSGNSSTCCIERWPSTPTETVSGLKILRRAPARCRNLCACVEELSVTILAQ